MVLAVSGCFAKLLSSPRASPLKCSFSMSDWVCVTHDRDALGYVLPAGFVVPPGKSARAGSFLLQLLQWYGSVLTLSWCQCWLLFNGLLVTELCSMVCVYISTVPTTDLTRRLGSL